MTQTQQGETLTITMSTDNAAFGAYPGYEIERILTVVAEQVKDEQRNPGTVTRPIRDVNGNRVGEWTWNHSVPDADY